VKPLKQDTSPFFGSSRGPCRFKRSSGDLGTGFSPPLQKVGLHLPLAVKSCRTFVSVKCDSFFFLSLLLEHFLVFESNFPYPLGVVSQLEGKRFFPRVYVCDVISTLLYKHPLSRTCTPNSLLLPCNPI